MIPHLIIATAVLVLLLLGRRMFNRAVDGALNDPIPPGAEDNADTDPETKP